MRVSFFVNNYPPSRGGVQELVARVAEGLVAAHGMHVEVLTSDALLSPGGPSPGRIPVPEEELRGVQVHRLSTARRLHAALRALRRAGRRFGWYEPGPNSLLITGPLGARHAMRARRLARRSDVVVGLGAPSASLWYAGRLAGRTAVLAVPFVHLGGDGPENVRPWVLRILRRSQAVVANTLTERRWLGAHGVDAGRVRVLSPGCELPPVVTPDAARRHLGLTGSATVGFIGRLAPHKGVDTLVASMRRVWADDPEVTLLLAGPVAGVDPDVLLADLSSGERAHVHVWGEFTDDERPWLLAACDVVAHPSRSESFGLAMIEAWSAARPVVVADIDVTRELVDDDVDGLLVPVGDAPALAAVLIRLLGSATDRHRIGRAGRARAERTFAWPVVVDGWADVLRSVAGVGDDSGCT